MNRPGFIRALICDALGIACIAFLIAVGLIATAAGPVNHATPTVEDRQ